MIDDRELLERVKSLSLAEKSALCSGLDAWLTKPNPQKGIPSLRMADGPHGVRVEDPKNARANGGPSKPATCFPPEVALACAWSPGLCAEVGGAIAEECLHYGVGLVLGPGVNIKRSPLCGRNFEYYSEDPLLAGELAAGFIGGVQAKGVGTSLKHYAVNNQEKLRMSIDSAVDERALFDIYLKAFEIAVEKARPATVMASYNRLDGTYATEHRRLLTEILRLRFGFTGVVVTDWGAVNDRAAGVAAGCDLEMPGTAGVNDAAIVRAVQNGSLSEDALDAACWNLLRLIFAYTREGKAAPACDFDAHHALAANALCQSAVLLKNEGGLLPLGEKTKVALIGEMAAKPRFQGGGSSVINPTRVTSVLAAMQSANLPFVYRPGHKGDADSPLLKAEAVSAAAAAEVAVVVVGLPDAYECEGYDREHLRLPEVQLELLEAVAQANPNTVVVLCCGGPVETPWLKGVRALLCPHLGGQALGDAVVRLLYGEENPGGRLAESWPRCLEDVPCAGSFPMGPNEVRYRESIYVGYRYYDAAEVPVRFPFGYGQSYTSFEYVDMSLSAAQLAPGGTLRVRVTLRNTGPRTGDEVVQLYLEREGSARFQPLRTLVAFGRVRLAPGEEQVVELEVPYARLGFYDVPSGGVVVEAGRYGLRAGPHSRELPLAAGFEADGVKLAPNEVWGPGSPYGVPSRAAFTDEAFARLYARPFEDNTPPQKGAYTMRTTLAQAKKSATGRFLRWIAFMVSKRAIRFSTDREANLKAARSAVDDLPLKNLVMNTGGRIGPRAAAALLDMCNGKRGFFRLVGALFAKDPNRR